MEQLIGQTIHNRYQIQSLLGRQIGRRTFLATDLKTQNSVVLKLLLFGPDFTWEDLKLFEREAQTLRSLAHPAIPQYLDCFDLETELGKGFALIQSYIEAASLQVWAESGRAFSEADLKAIATQLLDVLTYLHSQQPPVIHRDLKPSNILLGDRSGNSPGQVYLVDFGSVQTIQHGGTVTVVGTYGYMPPEQFGGRTVPASDLYSLGATLIYLLTRTHPADLPTRRGCLQFDVTAQVSDRLQAWLKCLVEPDLDQRFDTAQRALETLRNDQLPLNRERSPSQPIDSKVVFTKSDEQLQIIIPPIPLEQKLETVFNATLTTGFLGLPLLVFLIKPGLAWAITPLLAWAAYKLWSVTLAACFEEIQVTIDEQTITYITRSGLGRPQRYSSPTSAITRLEKSHFTYVFDQKIEHAALNIWAGNQRYSIAHIKSSSNSRRLTLPEIDWLASELSEWLDIPIQKPYEFPGGFEPFEEDSSKEGEPLKPIYASNVPAIQRPENAVCRLTKTAETLEITAPAGSPSDRAAAGCLVFLLSIPCFVIAASVINPLFGLALGAVPPILWQLSRHSLRANQAKARIALHIDANTVSLWKQTDIEQRLNEAPLKNIQGIQVCHLNKDQKIRGYHVQLKIVESAVRDRGAEEFIIVGNRKFWQSKREAFWLAYELSVWLKLPVTELEVVENSAA